ncbi:MAG TPA: PIN domain nuclease [Lentisphaeria bacterium]|nr:MAG: hypothetical protein A2X45_01960 [Lentisphaerae bacterium GWF2_50_93]HCE45447.1 PIN domain nuclease [Lentisphaeria bacterium]
MAFYLLDTGILIHIVRASALAVEIENKYSLSKPPNISLTSIISKAEILSFSVQRNWGDKNNEKLKDILRHIPIVDINYDKIIQKYAEIAAYSIGKHPTIKLPPGESASNLKDNDIWIASTASVLNAKLLTLDKDFLSLDKVFVDVVYIPQIPNK